MYISVFDYSTGKVFVLEDTEGIIKENRNDMVEELLSDLGFHLSNCSYMTTEDTPECLITTVEKFKEEL